MDHGLGFWAMDHGPRRLIVLHIRQIDGLPADQLRFLVIPFSQQSTESERPLYG